MVDLTVGVGILIFSTLALFSYHAPNFKRRLRNDQYVPIKTYSDRTVYALDHDNIRHVIPDWNTFVSSGFDASEIRTINDQEMNSYILGEALGTIEEIPLVEAHCPCDGSSEYEMNIKAQKPWAIAGEKICIVRNAVATVAFAHTLDAGFEWVSSQYNGTYYQSSYNTELPADLKPCVTVIEIGDLDQESLVKHECPEQCLPVAYSFVPITWLLLNRHDHTVPVRWTQLTKEFLEHRFSPHQPITCSMTFAQMFGRDVRTIGHRFAASEQSESDRRVTDLNMSSLDMLRLIAQRRFEECREQPYWKLVAEVKAPTIRHAGGLNVGPTEHLAIQKRHVHGLVMWIGSTTRYHMMQQQVSILRNVTTDPATTIVGWLASEAQYSCRAGSTLCESVSSTNSYHFGMPQTRLNVAANGWACAQRRPLRALAHALTLYAPSFVLLVDDDTFISITTLLSGPVQRYIRDVVIPSPLVFGELSKGRKVTRKGFYLGGAGYLFGKVIIDRLTSNVILGPDGPMSGMIEASQMAGLGLLAEATQLAKTHCPLTCLANYSTPEAPTLSSAQVLESLDQHFHVQAQSAVRLVDMCVNIMSGEHTCYHSDHAMTRCLVHGAYAAPMHIECGGSTIQNHNEEFMVGMCMGVDGCDYKIHLTCHRWVPSAADPSRPVNM